MAVASLISVQLAVASEYPNGWQALAWLMCLLTSVFEVSVARAWLTGEPFRVSQLAEVRVLLPASKRHGQTLVCVQRSRYSARSCVRLPAPWSADRQ